ncbi:MAG: TrkH family potassium uptake protein [Fibrobacterota bacterium]
MGKIARQRHDVYRGLLSSLFPIPFILHLSPGPFSIPYGTATALLSSIFLLLSAQIPGKKIIQSHIYVIAGSIFGIWSLSAHIISSPFAALTASIYIIYLIFFFRIKNPGSLKGKNEKDENLSISSGAAIIAAPVPAILSVLTGLSGNEAAVYGSAAALLSAYIFNFRQAVLKKSTRQILLSVFLILFTAASAFMSSIEALLGLAFLSLPFGFKQIKDNNKYSPRTEYFTETIFSHPARVLLLSFSFLCILGTLLLLMPVSSNSGNIKSLDAVFTSVSAVCVTGLTVVDTGKYFSFTGQLFIIILIQLGGLGIMSITSVALHAMGRRLSLKHEKYLFSMADSGHKDLFESLRMILKFTFLAEAVGTLLLFIAFYTNGSSLTEELWRAVFTSVSAFCNAGFSLQTASLTAYTSNPLALYTVSILIILGGMAPATCILIPRWLSGRYVSLSARITLVTTSILLLIGTLFIAAFEWNGILGGLTLTEKINNAWFQSVTLRTAGFNSVDIAGTGNPGFLLMLIFMFIGGSPGGTAGGIKTATFAILALTFWTNIKDRTEINAQYRKIPHTLVYRAVTITISGTIIWFLTVFMLEMTQQISFAEIVFEATSAIGTVGLSTGATGKLDEIGKIIVTGAMFAGRTGPVTLFMLLGTGRVASGSHYPEEKISLT